MSLNAEIPGIVRAIHKENGGHGDAVMTGLANATGRYFKVVDSDDWVDEESFKRVLARLKAMTEKDESVDMLICNYVYDKVGVKHKHVMQYRSSLPVDCVFGWDEVNMGLGHYLLMHSVIYRHGSCCATAACPCRSTRSMWTNCMSISR